MRTLKLTKDSQKNILESLLKRSPNNYTEYESTVNEIINNVKGKTVARLFLNTAKKFDKADVDASNIRVTEEEIKEAYELVDEKLLAVIKKGSCKYQKISREAAAELMVYNRGRHHFRTEGHTYSKGRSICAGRQGCLSFICADERASCKGSRR
mgnify:CR=1 FL=1